MFLVWIPTSKAYICYHVGHLVIFDAFLRDLVRPAFGIQQMSTNVANAIWRYNQYNRKSYYKEYLKVYIIQVYHKLLQ